jgi:hypothetical protein
MLEPILGGAPARAFISTTRETTARRFCEQQPPIVRNDSQDDSQTRGRLRTTADGYGLLTLAIEPGRTLTDPGGH